MEFRSLVKSALPFVAILEVRDAVSFRIGGGSRGLQAPECSGSRMGLQARVFVSVQMERHGVQRTASGVEGMGLGRCYKSSANWVRLDVPYTAHKLLFGQDLALVEAAHPYIVLALQAERKAALDELHRFFQRNIRSGRNQSVEMLRHDDECVQEEFSLAAIVEEGALE